MNALFTATLVFGGLAVLVCLWFIGSYNSLVRLKALVDEAWSGINVQLKRRYDLIPNLVVVVKQYAVHEKDILDTIARMRAAAMHTSDIEHKGEAEAGLTQALKALFVVVENYPTLKANENFMSLQKELATIEHEVQLSRRYYNGTVRNYNTAVSSFPTTIVAGVTKFTYAPYFEISNPLEREVPTVTF